MPVDATPRFVYRVHNRAVGEPFRPSVCWGEDSEHIEQARGPQRPTRLFAFYGVAE
jgi:hypothetical protein